MTCRGKALLLLALVPFAAGATDDGTGYEVVNPVIGP